MWNTSSFRQARLNEEVMKIAIFDLENTTFPVHHGVYRDTLVRRCGVFPQLVAIRGPLTGKNFVLGDQPLSLGRSNDNTIVISNRGASRRHAEIRREAQGYVLHDLNSSNGTFVNGEKVQMHPLNSGDMIAVGEETFLFQAGVQQHSLSAPELRLVGVHGPLVQQSFLLSSSSVSLGRNNDNTVVISSPNASRYHAEIRRESGGCMLYDLGSSNGTYVSGQRIQTHLLQPGDMIEIGNEAFRFEVAVVDNDRTLITAPGQQSIGTPSDPAASTPAASTPAASTPPSTPVSAASASAAGNSAGTPQYGIRCPQCGRIIDPKYFDCPWDGAALANGQTVFS
jgi:pSer/pThr/pTyr-binding forkhead associated (FHA) protein